MDPNFSRKTASSRLAPERPNTSPVPGQLQLSRLDAQRWNALLLEEERHGSVSTRQVRRRMERLAKKMYLRAKGVTE